MFKSHTKLLFGCIIITTLHYKVFAGDNTPSAKNNCPTEEYYQEQLKPKAKDAPAEDAPWMYCPEAKQLHKKDGNWYGPHGWRSYDLSFVNRILKFQVAQWSGVDFGSVVCLYQTGNNATFNIILKRSILSNVPHCGNWKKEKDYHQCVSSTPADCPFKKRKPPKKVDPYAEIDFYNNADH